MVACLPYRQLTRCASGTRAVRYRGNSAQQMGEYGREAARESCILLTATSHLPVAMERIDSGGLPDG
jgi:hypothetical protein